MEKFVIKLSVRLAGLKNFFYSNFSTLLVHKRVERSRSIKTKNSNFYMSSLRPFRHDN